MESIHERNLLLEAYEHPSPTLRRHDGLNSGVEEFPPISHLHSDRATTLCRRDANSIEENIVSLPRPVRVLSLWVKWCSSFQSPAYVKIAVHTWFSSRTVARRSSIKKLYLCAGGGALRSWMGGLTFKFDQNSTNLYCFIFQFRGGWSFVWEAKPTKTPRGDGIAFKSPRVKELGSGPIRLPRCVASAKWGIQLVAQLKGEQGRIHPGKRDVETGSKLRW